MSAMARVRALGLTPSSAARACKRAKNLRRSLSEGASGVRLLFEGYRRTGTLVELRGPCYSASTVITAYV
jgi:hypothetical protein